MASWIVHLRIAENLLQDRTDWHRGYFAIGNIAPDSGLPDEEWENFDPPPELLHFKSEEEGPMADLDFYRRYLDGVGNQELGAEVVGFRWGYFCHLVVDNLWHDEISEPTHQRFQSEFQADPKFIWTVKHDWYALDFLYVRQNPQFLFWHEFQTTDYTLDCLDFLPSENVQIRIDYIREYYQRKDEEREQWLVEMPGIYLTKSEMDGFVDRVSQRLTAIIDVLHHGFPIPSKPISALDLPIGT
jgi:hypothetical protein